MTETAWLVCTDLDASLLDGSYQWRAAEPAVAALLARGFPLVLNSSKTLAEMVSFAEALDPTAPVIAENGTVIAYPEASGLAASDGIKAGAFRVEQGGMKREELVQQAQNLREREGYSFQGFNEMQAETLMEMLGLSAEQARAALQRHSSEPILWKDSPEALEAFGGALEGEGIALVRGGHFKHLMPAGQSKGAALLRVLERYRLSQPDLQWRTLAIGDSPNDSSMLEIADQALVIPNPKRGTLQLKRPDYQIASAPGPQGWGAAILDFLNSNQPPATAT
jgi:mannosyl-3-phosphoglycerate phosphatase